MKFHLLRVARNKLKELHDPKSIADVESSSSTSGFAPDKEAANNSSLQTAINLSSPDGTYRSNRDGSAIDFLDSSNDFFSPQETGIIRDVSQLENAWWLNPMIFFSEDRLQ